MEERKVVAPGGLDHKAPGETLGEGEGLIAPPVEPHSVGLAALAPPSPLVRIAHTEREAEDQAIAGSQSSETASTSEHEPSTSPHLSIDEVKWLIDKVDGMRVSTENRAVVVLTADAFLLGGITFLLGNSSLLEAIQGLGMVARFLIFNFVGASSLLLVASVLLATAAIVNIQTTSRRLVGNSIPSRKLIHSWDTAFVYKDYASFKAGFIDMSEADYLDSCLAYLWSSHHLYMNRYLTLRIAIRALVLAIILFSIGAAYVAACLSPF